MSESESAIHTRHRAAVVRVEVVLVDEKRGGHPPERELPRRSGAADCGGRAGVSEHQGPLQLNGADHRAASRPRKTRRARSTRSQPPRCQGKRIAPTAGASSRKPPRGQGVYHVQRKLRVFFCHAPRQGGQLRSPPGHYEERATRVQENDDRHLRTHLSHELPLLPTAFDVVRGT